MSNTGNPNPNTPPDDETPAKAYETLADGTIRLSDGTLVKENGNVFLPSGRQIGGAAATQHLATLGFEMPERPAPRDRTSIVNVFDPSNDGNGHGNGNNHPQNGNGHGGGHGHAHSNDDSSKSNRGLTAAILLAIAGIIIGIIALLTNGDNGDGTKALLKVEQTDKNVATLTENLTTVTKSLKSTQTDVSTLQEEMKGLEGNVNTATDVANAAQLGVNNLNEELAGLKTDVGTMKTDVARAKKDAAAALRLARATDKNVTAIAAGQATQDASISALQADVASLKTTPPKVGGADPIKVRINQPGGGVEEYNLRN